MLSLLCFDIHHSCGACASALAIHRFSASLWLSALFLCSLVRFLSDFTPSIHNIRYGTRANALCACVCVCHTLSLSRASGCRMWISNFVLFRFAYAKEKNEATGQTSWPTNARQTVEINSIRLCILFFWVSFSFFHAENFRIFDTENSRIFFSFLVRGLCRSNNHKIEKSESS